jgi:hypothetical protein
MESTMIDVDKTRLVLDQIAHAKDPVSLVRELVLESGGTWIDAVTVDMAFLFEVNLYGVKGFGLGAAAAIDNWIANSEAVVTSDELPRLISRGLVLTRATPHRD